MFAAKGDFLVEARSEFVTRAGTMPTPRFAKTTSASSSLGIGVAELARVQVFGILANSATPKKILWRDSGADGA
jgi:hypothetical protein